MSARGLVKSLLISGGSQVIYVLISLVRVKILALMLGPAGYGLLGILNSLFEFSAKLGGLGMGPSGVRRISQVKEEPERLSAVFRVIMVSIFVQSFIVIGCFVLFYQSIASWVLPASDSDHAYQIGLVSVVVALTLIGNGVKSLLIGFRKLKQLALIKIYAAICMTILGLAIVYFYGKDGLIWLLLLQAAGVLFLSLWYARSLISRNHNISLNTALCQEWAELIKHGSGLMVANFFSVAALLLVNAYLSNSMGLAAVGFFAAANTIAVHYIGFIFEAIGLDFYPRLCEQIKDRPRAHRLVTDQTALLLAGSWPLMIACIGAASLLVPLLYDDNFLPAAAILQWQMLGSMVRLMGHQLFFLFAAENKVRVLICSEALFNGCYLGLFVCAAEWIGLEAVGAAYFMGRIAQVSHLYWMARRQFGFRWSGGLIKRFGLYFAFAAMILGLALYDPTIGVAVSIPAAVISGVIGLRFILSQMGPEGKYPAMAAAWFDKMGWAIRYDAR